MLEASTKSILLDWPGKSSKYAGEEHPAVYHMLDVAAVAELLLEPCDFPHRWKAAFTVLIGLHDLGKVGNSFRNMLRVGEIQTIKHWELTEAWLVGHEARWHERFEADERVWKTLIGAIAGHHGRPSERAERYFSRFREQEGEHAKRDIPSIVTDLLKLWPDASLADLTRDAANKLSWQLSGLTVAADWVGSNTQWFPAQFPTLSLSDYLIRARKQAQSAVHAAGLNTASVRSDNLDALFDFTLRPMQHAALDIALPDGQMLAFIEDETGAGKTEAAMILAHRMLAAGKARGLYLALPTMATADAMFTRAQEFMGRIFNMPSLTLAHGRASLSTPFRNLIGRSVLNSEDEDDVTCTPWLADNRRRALLANVGIGTIDQALLAVMPTKFSTLRLWGLASKILVVDEAHEIAGDHYMVKLLAALLQVHAAQGGSAILLTATLPLQDRAKLTRAFAEGAGNEWPEDTSLCYPSLSIPGGEARREFDQEPGLKGAVSISRIAAMDEAIDLLVQSAAQGAACVWIRNSVDEAIAAAAALRARGTSVSLLHARFAFSDRKTIEAEELKRFGRDGLGREGRVLVATQIVESSLDLDFDVMVSDLAPIAALIQRAGRLWRHMTLRPRYQRVVPEAILHVLSPDPEIVLDAEWLKPTLGRGAFVYPIADQWRTAKTIFEIGKIQSPAGLRDLIESVSSATEKMPVPLPLQAAELERQGLGYAEGTLASCNLINFEKGYRDGGAGANDMTFPTRLGHPTQTLVLARRQDGRLIPWSTLPQDQNEPWMPWILSEVQAAKRRLKGLSLPESTLPDIVAVTQDWPEWRRKSVTLCPVDEHGVICTGLRYDSKQGLLFE